MLKEKAKKKMKNDVGTDTSTDVKPGEVVMIINRHERRKQAALERKRVKNELLRNKNHNSKSNPV